jgi:hypothetical protein
MLKWYAINLLNGKLWINQLESNDFSKVKKILKQNASGIILNQALFEELKNEIQRIEKENLKNSNLNKIQELNHGDISNEVECRLGLYDPKTGNELLSRNSTFRVVFDESEKGYLKVIIKKKPI